jgi:uncharacterized protein YgiM (DUF1202 family)
MKKFLGWILKLLGAGIIALFAELIHEGYKEKQSNEPVVEKSISIEKATISDPDGYTNIRQGKGTGYPVVDKLYEGEEFTVENMDDENWWSVIKNNGKKGYVHKSRIKIKRKE